MEKEEKTLYSLLNVSSNATIQEIVRLNIKNIKYFQ